MRFISLILLFIALFLETSITTIPLVFLVLISATVISKEPFMFLYAFLFGLLLDLVNFNPVGASSIFFVFFLFLLLMYQRRFEIATGYFVLIAAFLGSLLYVLLFSPSGFLFLEALVSAIIALGLFGLLRKTNKALDNN